MPYEVKKRNGKYVVVKEGGSDSLGEHDTPDEAYAQIAAIEHRETGKSISILDAVRALSVSAGPLLEGKVHEIFTVVADRLFQGGVLSRDERIALSGGIGKSLDKLSGVIADLGLDNREVPNEILLDLATKALSGQSLVSDHWIANTMVSFGDSVKDLSDKGHVGGYLVVFSPNGEKDLMGDYFTKATDFRWAGREGRLAIYHHGMDDTLKKMPIGTEWQLVRKDDVGLWVEAQLNMRKEYERAVYGLVRQKAMGLSSGTASHLIEREDDGNIKLWAIVEGSYTPTPMEKRTMVMPLSEVGPVQPFRSLVGLQQQIGRATGRGSPTQEGIGSDVRQIVLADPIELIEMFVSRR